MNDSDDQFFNVDGTPVSLETMCRLSPKWAAIYIRTEMGKLKQVRAALDVINGIRNSIIGTQSVNWSEHIYPLVAALDGAGFSGESYPEARANVGTLIERATAAIARVAELEALVAEMKKPDPLQEKIDALTRRVLDAAQPKPRDESVPPPGWHEDEDGWWVRDEILLPPERHADAWNMHDAEHGYAPPPKPRGRWPKDRDPIARMHEILQGSDMSLDDEGPGLLACIDKIQDDRDAIRADERRRTQRDIAHHMRCSSGRWGDVINDIEAGTYERVDAAAELEEPSR